MKFYQISLTEDEVKYMELMYLCESDRAIRERLQRLIEDILPPPARIGFVLDELKKLSTRPKIFE